MKNIFKKIVLSLTICTIFILSACTYSINLGGLFNGYKGTGEIETRKYDLEGFEGIDATGGVEIYLVKADDYDISVETNSDIFERLEIKTSNKKLIVKPIDGVSFYNTSIKIVVKCPKLNFVDISNSTSVDIAGGFKSNDDVYIEVSNSSYVGGEISGEDLVLDIANSSDVDLSGEFNVIDVEASNSSDANLKGIEAEYAKIDLANSSDCDIDISGDIEVEASNSSDLNVYGGTVIKSDLSNSSDINYR